MIVRLGDCALVRGRIFVGGMVMDEIPAPVSGPLFPGLVVLVLAVGALYAMGVSMEQDMGEASDVDREFGAPVRLVGPADRAVEEADECLRTRNGVVLCVLDDDSGARVVRVVGMERPI